MLIETESEALDAVESETIAPVLQAIVAIPVCNEGERIAACLTSIERQTGLRSNSLGLVLFLNNCTDETAAIAAGFAARSRLAIRIVERDWAGANAGWARREAMEAAARWLRQEGAADGTILTTDADSRVPPDWVARNLAELAAGADAVAGRIALDAAEAARLPDALHARGRLEGAYEALLTELAAALDPVPHDPWPTHWTQSGATLAVRLPTYLRVGGMPAVSVGEDRAFAARLLADDARIRHAPDIVVVTSGRLDGRAPGGAADTMRMRCEAPESPCDEKLETLPRAVFRYLWRRRLRGLHAGRGLNRVSGWASALAISREEARQIARSASFGEAWAAVEATSPRLIYRPLTPRELPPQILRARAALAIVRISRRLVGWWGSSIRGGHADALSSRGGVGGRGHSADCPEVPPARPPARSDASRPLGPPRKGEGWRGLARRAPTPGASVLQTRISPVGPDHTS